MTEPFALSTQPVAGPPTLVAPAEAEAARLAQSLRLTAVLRGAAKGFGCTAAELWLLDDATRSLHRRAHWQADPSAPRSAGRRPLAEAEPDLAALAGGAVVLEGPADFTDWNPHRAAGAAFCLPVSSDRTIHGVVWFFADKARLFGDRLLELGEIVGGRLAVEIERDALLAASGGPLADRLALANDLPAPAEEADPSPPAPGPSLAEDTLGSPADDAPHDAPVAEPPAPARARSVAAEAEAEHWAAPDSPLALAEQLWLPDGRLVAWCATVIDPPTDEPCLMTAAAGSARAVRNAIRRHAPQTRDVGQLLSLAGDPLWAPGSSGDGFSIALAVVEPADDPGLGGRGAFATAGPSVVLRVRASATSTHAGDAPPLGWDADASYAPRPFELRVRERLVMVVGDPRLTSPMAERQLADAFRSATADAHRSMRPAACLQRVRHAGCEAVHAAVAVRRL